MVAHAAGEFAREGGVVQAQQAFGDGGAFRPDDGREVGGALRARHGKLGERAGGEKMLQRAAVMRQIVGDGADDAGLAIGQMGDADAGLVAQWAAAAFGGDHEAAGNGGAIRDVDEGAIVMAFHLCLRGREDPQRRQFVQRCVQGHAQAAGLDHPAEGVGFQIVRRFAGIEMQEEAGGRPADAAIGDADVVDWAGGEGQAVPQAGLFQFRARSGGDGVGAAIEIRVFHRWQRRAIDHRGGDSGTGETTGQGAAHGSGPHHADIGFDRIGHA